MKSVYCVQKVMMKSALRPKSDNIEMMFNDEADEVIKEFFDSLRNRYQNNLESVKASEFVFNYVRFFSITNVIKYESH